MQLTLKQARLLSEMSQKLVASKLGVHVQTYMKWERNPDLVPVGKAKELSKIFGRNIDEIFFGPKSTESRQDIA